jgi:predicted AAA+ superfamily ATPase
MEKPPMHRALLISGARQVGKTTLMLQAIQNLIVSGVPSANILYATFDHPLLKLTRLEDLLGLWREFEPSKPGVEYLFLDEIQSAKDWQTWLKHQVDFEKGRRRIAVTGSAMPLTTASQESGVGRWHTLNLATLSFYEYLQLRKSPFPKVPEVASLAEAFDWTPAQWSKTADLAKPLTGLFHEYLLRGGFPQSALVDSIELSQKLLREDIVDKVLKRDMTALFGVRNILELEQVFLYLCMHDGGLLDIPALCNALELQRSTVSHFIALLESTHLIYRLMPYGYGKQVLRGRPKVYLADPAIAPAVLMKGKSLLENPTAMGKMVETAFFKHVTTHYSVKDVAFSYWKNADEMEVDIVAQVAGETIPFEVKYRSQSSTGAGELKGLSSFCDSQKVSRGYVITREWSDYGIIDSAKAAHSRGETGHAKLLKIPAPLACYWLGQSEIAIPPES